MSVKFNELNLTLNNEIKKVNVNGIEINVKQYLPVEDKVNLVQIALQQAMVNNMYDEALIEAYFYTYMVMYYTDLEFTDEEKAEPLKIYDLLESNNVFEAIFNEIPEYEYDDVFQYLTQQIDINIRYQTSLSFTITQFLNQISEATKNLNTKDWEKLAEIIQTQFKAQ